MGLLVTGILDWDLKKKQPVSTYSAWITTTTFIFYEGLEIKRRTSKKEGGGEESGYLFPW